MSEIIWNGRRVAVYIFLFGSLAILLFGSLFLGSNGWLNALLFGPEKAFYHRERLKLVDDRVRLKVTGMKTIWGEDLDADSSKIPWTEYPRPSLVRSSHTWLNLNGIWDYAVTTVEEPDGIDGIPYNSEYDGKIRVPFCVESALSGVQKPLPLAESLILENDKKGQPIFAPHRVALWYKRRFNLPLGEPTGLDGAFEPLRYFLNFEAVDYEAKVWVNGRHVGGHQGGFNPWRVEITNVVYGDMSVSSAEGTHELVVRVIDPTDGAQLRGKQSKHPKNIWYSSVSGIWQTVWIEAVPRQHIVGLRTSTKKGARRSKTVTIIPSFDLPKSQTFPPGYKFAAEVRSMGGGTIVAHHQETLFNPLRPTSLAMVIADPKSWTPSTPYLYDVKAFIIDNAGRVVDEVSSYFAIRDVGKARDRDGQLRMTLNGQPVFMLGTLDQGWWPDGLLTPPSDAAQLHDIEFLKACGFNTIRKHAKVENRRYYYHCDRLGMLVWQDQVSADQNGADKTILSPNWRRMVPELSDEGVWTDEEHAQYMLEFAEMVAALEPHPSIVVWTPFNEAWGQHRTVEVAEWITKHDPTRLVDAASGGNWFPSGDIADNHNYPAPAFPIITTQTQSEKYKDYIKVVGEFGGHGLAVDGHLWSGSNSGGKADTGNWGYGKLPKHATQLKDYYHTSMNELRALKERHGIAAGIYTQTTDVEGEINGLLTYDRKVTKIDPSELKEWHQILVGGAVEF